jgi:hypothetical protein
LFQSALVPEENATDDFFRNDIGIRGVNRAWFARMHHRPRRWYTCFRQGRLAAGLLLA